MYYGVAYYPEHWPEQRWAVDAKLMQEAGVNGVRMGEFAWSVLQPREGEYRFDWLDRAVELLAQHGIKTMMCTCSRTPPPWVFTKYPEIRNTPADRLTSNYGHRYTVCHNSPTFRHLSQRIDRAVVEHYADNEDVIAWHIDNEIGAGSTCYCDICRGNFHDYLRDMAGIEIDDYGALPEPLLLCEDAVEFEGDLKQAELWADEIILTSARAVATYAEGWLAGTPAITVNEHGEGKVVYVGTVLTGETLEAFLRWLRRLAGVESVLDVPPGVRAFERRSRDTRFLFLLNPTDSPQPVTLGDEWRDAFTGERASAIDILPVDVRIVTLGL